MVAQPTARPAQKPTIKLVDIHAGDYLVSSSDGTTFYAVNVARITCTCKAGQTGFRSCKHLPYCKHVAAAKYWARCLHDTRTAGKEAARVAARAAELIWDAPASTHPSALLEAYPTAA